MTQVHLTLKQKNQKLIQESVKDDLSNKILTKVFNDLGQMVKE